LAYVTPYVVIQEITRNSYSLYKRESGNRTIWYVRFWAEKWLAEGQFEAKKKDLKATKNRLVATIAKYLKDCDVIKKGEVYETAEILKLFYTQVTNQQLASGEKFVDYLYCRWMSN
jgi:hypothetical protein